MNKNDDGIINKKNKDRKFADFHLIHLRRFGNKQ